MEDEITPKQHSAQYGKYDGSWECLHESDQEQAKCSIFEEEWVKRYKKATEKKGYNIKIKNVFCINCNYFDNNKDKELCLAPENEFGFRTPKKLQLILLYPSAFINKNNNCALFNRKSVWGRLKKNMADAAVECMDKD